MAKNTNAETDFHYRDDFELKCSKNDKRFLRKFSPPKATRCRHELDTDPYSS